MSVQTELDRLNAAKNSLKTAIEGKGVAVPDGTKLDAYSAFVEQISSGSDSNVVVVNIKINGLGTPVQLEDEIFNALTSDTTVAIVKNAGISSGINSYLYKSNEGMDDSLSSLKDQTVYLSSPQFISGASAYLNYKLTIDKTQKTATLYQNVGFCVPSTESANEGDVLKLVDGLPTWSTLPIYNGEVE